MIEKEKLLNELKNSFNKLKDEFGFNSEYNDVEESGDIEDLVLSEGFVSTKLLRKLTNRISEKFYSWIGVLHSLVMPPPSDMISTSEHKKLNDEEKKELFEIIKKIMYFVRKSKRIAFEMNNVEEAKFLDELVNYDKNMFSPKMAKYHKKLEDAWKQE
jgi:hypothetical protein|tara:strand:- start:1362 stop:1835 length:474 start_codon:yes stop_codon:yes gene_type:complete